MLLNCSKGPSPLTDQVGDGREGGGKVEGRWREGREMLLLNCSKGPLPLTDQAGDGREGRRNVEGS